MNSWSQRWHLHLNSSKFRLIQLHLSTASSSNTHSYIINGQTIESSTSHRDLGIFLTVTLNWEEHYHCISLRTYKQLGLMWRTFRSTQVSPKKELYISLVRSKLAYCSPIWRPNQIQHILLLEKVQRLATKFILSNSSLDYKARLVSLHLLPLMSWLELADIMLLVKHIKYLESRLIIFIISPSLRAEPDPQLLQTVLQKVTNHQIQTFLLQQSMQIMEWTSIY